LMSAGNGGKVHWLTAKIPANIEMQGSPRGRTVTFFLSFEIGQRERSRRLWSNTTGMRRPLLHSRFVIAENSEGEPPNFFIPCTRAAEEWPVNSGYRSASPRPSCDMMARLARGKTLSGCRVFYHVRRPDSRILLGPRTRVRRDGSSGLLRRINRRLLSGIMPQWEH